MAADQELHRRDADVEAGAVASDLSVEDQFHDIVTSFDIPLEDDDRPSAEAFAADDDEVIQENPFDQTELGSGKPEEDGVGRSGRTSKSAVPLLKPPAASSREQQDEPVTVQGWTSKPFALKEQLSLDTLRRSPDHFSLYDIPAQVDGGRGMAAMARAFADRERSHVGSTEKTVIWAYSHSGLDVREFLASLRELDSDGSISARIRVVLATDSQERLDAIKKSEILKEWDVSFDNDNDVIDPQDPESITLPENTGIVLLPDTIDKLPAHQVLRGAKSEKLLERLDYAQADPTKPLVHMSGRTGQASLTEPDILRAHEIAEGSERFDAIHQFAGKVSMPPSKAFELQYTDLDTSDASVAAFWASMPERLRNKPGTVFNYSPDVADFVRTVTEGVRDDGLVYISGPLRGNGWLKPDRLSSTQGAVVSHVLEETTIRDAATIEGSATAQPAVYSVSGTTGEQGYMVIDRKTAQGDSAGTRAIFEQAVKPPDAESSIALAAAELEAAREPLRAAGQEGNTASPADPAEAARRVRDAYDRLVELYPQASRDPSLSLALARECGAAKLYSEAYAFASDSAKAAPHLSGAHIEMARAEVARGNHDAALRMLSNAYELSPRNPEVHATLIDMWDGNETLKDEHLPQYVEAVSAYLEYAPNLTNKEIVDKLEAISKALRRDWQIHQNDKAPYKTILIQDIETGALREHHISVGEMKRIIAADSALRNAEAIGTLFDYAEPDNEHERLLQAQTRLFEIWQSVVPRDAKNLPVPRDHWIDEQPSRTERWIFNGSIYQSDEQAPPPDASKIWKYEREKDEEPVEATGYLDDADEEILESRSSMVIGESTSLFTGKPVGAFEIFKPTLPGHMFITGRTRMGKTTLLGQMFEQLPPMNVNFWAFDLGDKSELAEVGEGLRTKDLTGDRARLVEKAEYLKAQGTPVVIIAPGDKDSIPVSVDLFTPVEGCSIEEHIGKFVDTWITAYGGGGDSPVSPILAGALRDIYAANGWPVKPIEGETLPEVGEGEPTTPTLRELLDACIRRSAEYGKGTDAGNIPVYFKKRIEALEAGDFGDFLVGENVLDWEDLFKANVIFDFSHITSRDQRRFLFTALTMQASNYLQFNKGLSKEVNTVWAMDEASLITQGADDGEYSRKQGVEAFTNRLRVLGGYGISIWSATQTLEGVDKVFLTQNAATVGLSLKHVDDITGFLESMGVARGTEKFDLLFTKLVAAEKGVALAWSEGMEEPVRVNVTKPEEPSAAQIEAAKRWKVRPPIKPNPYDNFTARQREEAMRIAQSSKQAWKKIFVGAVTIAHVAHIDLPSVPEALERQWAEETDAEADGDKEFARLVLYYIAKQAVSERISAVRKSYPPKELTASVVAHALGILNGEPGAGTKPSPSFSLRSIREAITYRKLTDPRFGTAPRQQQLAGPLAFDLPNPVETVESDMYRQVRGRRKKRDYRPVSDTVAALRQHDASPFNGAHAKLAEKNVRTAFEGIIGKYNGRSFWQSIRYATGGELDYDMQRRLVAAQLGYAATSFSVTDNDFEELLSLSAYLYKRLPKKAEKTAKSSNK